MHDGMLLNKSKSKTDLCPLNISAISWRSVLLVEEPECPVKTTDLSQITDKLYQILSNVVSSTSHHEQNSNSHR
jgi:hypothetical protein